MSEMLSKIYALLLDVILPNLKAVHISQAEQTVQAERLNRNLEEFRTEMQIRMAEIRAEIALCRQELEDARVILEQTEEADVADIRPPKKKRIVN
jgi:hypothetical protein